MRPRLHRSREPRSRPAGPSHRPAERRTPDIRSCAGKGPAQIRSSVSEKRRPNRGSILSNRVSIGRRTLASSRLPPSIRSTSSSVQRPKNRHWKSIPCPESNRLELKRLRVQRTRRPIETHERNSSTHPPETPGRQSTDSSSSVPDHTCDSIAVRRWRRIGHPSIMCEFELRNRRFDTGLHLKFLSSFSESSSTQIIVRKGLGVARNQATPGRVFALGYRSRVRTS